VFDAAIDCMDAWMRNPAPQKHKEVTLATKQKVETGNPKNICDECDFFVFLWWYRFPILLSQSSRKTLLPGSEIESAFSHIAENSSPFQFPLTAPSGFLCLSNQPMMCRIFDM
jgi:hypothetical protein